MRRTWLIDRSLRDFDALYREIRALTGEAAPPNKDVMVISRKLMKAIQKGRVIHVQLCD